MFASRIERIEPERVLLTSRRAARIRVVGTCRGWLRCGSERRWVWGRFDHSFVVRAHAATLSISVAGLGGWSCALTRPRSASAWQGSAAGSAARSR